MCPMALNAMAWWTLSLVALAASAASAALCPASEFPSEPLVLSCAPGNGSIRLDLLETSGSILGRIPAGYSNMELRLASASSNSMHLQLLDEEGNCLVGQGCLMNSSCSNETDFCHLLDGMPLSYVSGSFLTVGVQETLRVTGAFGRLWQVRVALEWRSSSVAVGLVDYVHQGTQLCPKPLPGCRRCSDFEGCLPGQTAVCLGDGQMPSCSNEPALPEKQDWFEVRLGATLSAVSAMPGASCGCCELPLAETVKIGMAWPVNSNGPADAEAFVVISTLQHYLRWFNQQRGGLCVGRSRHLVELLVLDTQGSQELYPSALQRLAYDHNISLFLGPLEGEAMADMAQRLDLLILSPLLTSADLLRRCHSCFSLQPSPKQLLLPALTLLESRSDGVPWRVVYIQGDDRISQESCAVPNLTRLETFRWSVDLEGTAWTPPVAAGLDVWVLCTQSFKHCMNFLEFWGSLNASQTPKAVILSAPCVSVLQALPKYGGFFLGVMPLNLWAAWTSNAVDESWSSMTLQDLLPWFSSLVGANSQDLEQALVQAPTGKLHNNETAWDFQRQAEILTLRKGRPLVPSATWASLGALLTAVERAGAPTPEAVSSYFRGLKEGDLETITGPVIFDADGALSHGAWLTQLLPQDPTPQLLTFSWEGTVCTPASGCEVLQRLQNSSVLQPLRDPVLPLPVQGDRACFESGSSTWGFEVLPHGSFCDECVSNKVSIFDPQLHRRFCRSCGVSEYVMDLGNGTRICLPCEGSIATCASGFYTLNCQCRECDAGTFGANGTCHPCPVGHVSNSSGATSCQPCPAGSSSPGGTGCVTCSPGTFAGGAGTSCTACPGGRAAPDAGMTGCQGCPEGHRSDGVKCQKCPEGTYQPNQNSSECLLAVEGADFDGQGLVTGINREGYWTRRMGTEVTWEPCVAPQQCLRNESCASGSAGVQCFSCLPRHVRGGSDGCDPCNSLEAALGLGTFIVLVVFFALTLAKLGLARRNRPKDLRVVYIKIFLLYLVVADALLETALQALRLRPSVAFLSRFVVSAVSPQLLRWARCAGDAAARVLEAVGASHGMVQALWASEMSEASASCELGGLNAWPHGSWFSPEARPLVQKLAAYQGAVELLQLIFWFLLPWVLWIFLYLSALCFVRLRLCKDRSFLKSCLRFYEELVKDGTRETLACYDAEDWLSFCKAYFQTTGYLWSSLALFEAADLGGCRSFLKSFSDQARPLLVALLLVIYAPVLMGLVEAFRCLQLGDESTARSFFSPELPCGDLAVPYTWINLSLALLWALGVPVFLSNMLRKVRNSLPDDFEFPPDYAVTSFGYRLGCWNWEMYIFFLKALIVFSVLLGPAGRSSFLFFLAILHGVLTRAMKPFTGRSHFALVKWDHRFALFFLFNSIMVQGLRFSSNVEIVNQILATGMVLLLLLLNLLLVLLLLWDSFNCWHETYVESYEFYEWELWHNSRSRFGIGSRLVLLLLNQYKRRVRSRAYVSFDVQLGWLTICGSHGDQARCSWNWHEDGTPCLLSEAPLRLPKDVRSSTLAQRSQVQKYLQKAAERLCLIRGSPSFSVVELEFLIRASFVFARREELQRSRLTKQRTVISREESFLGLDALQLLWNSLEDEEGDKPAGRGSTFARRSSCSSHSSQQPLAESVRKRFQAPKICESFFSDPGKVLFFYSRAEFIRQVEAKKLKGADVNRMSTIPTERTPVLTVCCKLVGHIGEAYRTLCRRRRTSSFAAERSAFFRGGRGMKTHLVRGLDQVDPIIQEMFDPETFSRGLELQEFQMGLIMVEHTKDSELKALQDAFHDRWFQHRLVVEHQMRKQQGALKDQSVQADADEDMSEQLAQESLQARMTDEDRPTVEDLRWMRLVMKAGGGLFKEKVMPSLAEINQLLRERHHGDVSSSGSEVSALNCRS